jgi:O-antigen ligase
MEVFMTADQPYPLQKQNPLLYWTTLIFLVGAPNFIHFDVTGRTHTQGLLNPTSLSAMAINFVSTYVLIVVVLLSRRPLLCRKVNIAGWLWIVLLLQLLLSTALAPPSRLTPPQFSDIFIALYRMYEWILAFALILALYTRIPEERGAELVVQLIGRMSWIWIAMVYLILPIMPSQVYGGAGEGEIASAHAQLGGQLLSPSYLSTLTVAAFFYSLFFFPRGLIKFCGCVVAFVTLVLAHTRIEQASFLLLILLYAIFFSGKFFLRIATIISTAVLAALGILFRSSILEYIARGQNASSLATLNDRTRVWAAAIEAIRARPILGYGYVVGAKNALRDHWKYTHWIPPHAHNEYIHAFLSGGILAALLVACIYGRALWAGFRTAHRGHHQIFLLFIMILFTVRSLGGPNMIYLFTRPGGVFLLVFIGLVGGAASNKSRAKLRKVSQSSTHSIPQEVGA